MQWNVDVRTSRAHDATGDLPPKFEAAITLKKPEGADVTTMADFRNLLTTAVNNLNIPPTALVLEGLTLFLRWE